MSSVVLYQHLDLGDEIICNGLVREYCRHYDQVTIFAKFHNYASVVFMFRDLRNLTIIKGDRIFAKIFIFVNAFRIGTSKYDEVKTIGFPNLDWDGEPFEKQYYKNGGVDFIKKWDSFYVKRDFSREQALFDKIAPRENYAFLHDDSSRNFTIDRKRIDQKYTVIFPERNLTDNVFDYCTLIEKAKEIHVIDSSFMFLIDCLPYHNPSQKLFVHRYARVGPIWTLPVLKKNWQILS